MLTHSPPTRSEDFHSSPACWEPRGRAWRRRRRRPAPARCPSAGATPGPSTAGGSGAWLDISHDLQDHNITYVAQGMYINCPNLRAKALSRQGKCSQSAVFCVLNIDRMNHSSWHKTKNFTAEFWYVIDCHWSNIDTRDEKDTECRCWPNMKLAYSTM